MSATDGGPREPAALVDWLSWRGRISRRDYWTRYALPIATIHVLAGAIDASLGYPLVSWSPWSLSSSLALALTAWPGTVGTAKRLHDHGLSGWWTGPLWLAFLGTQASAASDLGNVAQPVSGFLILVGFYLVGLKRGTLTGNRHGVPITAARGAD